MSKNNMQRHKSKINLNKKKIIDKYNTDINLLITNELALLEHNLNNYVDTNLRSIILNNGSYNCLYLKSQNGINECTSMIQKHDVCIFVGSLGTAVYKETFKQQIHIYQLVLKLAFIKEVPEFIYNYFNNATFRFNTDIELQTSIDDSSNDLSTIIKKYINKHDTKAPCILDNYELAIDINTIRIVYKGLIQTYLVLKKEKDSALSELDKQENSGIMRLFSGILQPIK